MNTVPLRRLPDWASRLEQFLTCTLLSPPPFEYGVWDCCMFPADAICMMTGVDVAATVRRQYTSRRTFLALMQKRMGFPDVPATLPDFVGHLLAPHSVPEIPPSSAGRGDLVAIRRPLGHSLGLVSLKGTGILAVGEDRRGVESIGILPLTCAERAWRI